MISILKSQVCLLQGVMFVCLLCLVFTFWIFKVFTACQVRPPAQKGGIFCTAHPAVPSRLPRPVWSCLLQPERGVSLWAASSVRCRCLCCWCRCVCSSSGCRWCVKAPRNTRKHPPGDLYNKSSNNTYQCRRFHLKRRSEVAYLSSLWLDSRDAGRAAPPGPFTSVLKKRGGEENLRPGLFSALDKKKKETEA